MSDISPLPSFRGSSEVGGMTGALPAVWTLSILLYKPFYDEFAVNTVVCCEHNAFIEGSTAECTAAADGQAGLHIKVACLLPVVGSKQAVLCRNVRTSQGTFIARHEDGEGVLAWIEDRLAQLTGLPVDHGEVRLPLLAMHNPRGGWGWVGGGRCLPIKGWGKVGLGGEDYPWGGGGV